MSIYFKYVGANKNNKKEKRNLKKIKINKIYFFKIFVKTIINTKNQIIIKIH